MDFNSFLQKMVETKASDLFITVGRPPCIKVNGVIQNIAQVPFSADQTKELIYGLMDARQQEEFTNRKEFNFAIDVKGLGRFRVSAFYERFHVGAVLRRILTDIPILREMGLPPAIKDLALVKRGLVIVAGATGVGKSTTLAAMLGFRNSQTTGHIITIEDPIEYVHQHEKCIITQREVGVDTDSYAIALKNTLRQAPDVIMIGEIRSADTMEYAIQFAETGHLCLATLHANNANQSLDRIVSFFPAVKQAQILLELSLNLKGIVAQQLVTTIDGKNRVPAVEILLNTPIIQQCIKRGEIGEIKQYMQKGVTDGMQTFDQALFELYKNKKISYDEALKYADSENDLRLMVKMDKGASGKGENFGEIRLQD